MKKIVEGTGKSYSDPLNYYYINAKVYDSDNQEIQSNDFQNTFYQVTQVEKPRYGYDFVKALNLLRVGDSVYFSFLPDSFFLYYYGILAPSILDKKSPIHLHVKVLNILNQEEYDIKLEKSKAEMKDMAFQEFDKYLRENKITENPIGKGTVKVTTKAGSGVQANYGDKVEIQFKQWVMGGKMIENTYQTGGPVEYEIGGEGDLLGLSEALMKMKVGEKANVFIPYFLAFGEAGQPPQIPPYSNLIMEVELIQMIKQ